MIENDRQFEHTVQQLAKMYRLRDEDAAEPLYDACTREDVVDGTVSLIHKLEREVAAFLAAHPERVA